MNTVIETLLAHLHPGDRFRVVCGNYACGGTAESLNDALKKSAVLSIVKDEKVLKNEWEYAGGWRYSVKVRSTPKIKAAIEQKF